MPNLSDPYPRLVGQLCSFQGPAEGANLEPGRFRHDAESFEMPNRAGPQQGVAQKGRLAAGLSKLNSMCSRCFTRFRPSSVDMLRTPRST